MSSSMENIRVSLMIMIMCMHEMCVCVFHLHMTPLTKSLTNCHNFKLFAITDAPNMFTQKGYTHEHRQNVQNMVDQIDLNKREAIVDGRNATKGFNLMIWKMIRKHGTFTGPQSLKLGLVDHLPKLCPLDGLLESNSKGEQSKAAMTAKWGNETDVQKFQATEKISFSKYQSILAKRKKLKSRQWQLYHRLQDLAGKSSAFESLLGVMGYSAPTFNISKVS